ncbi:MAG: twin-arginine translocase TatA/TatE family subunit [Spirochaetes bacterium]|nr:twin-arginine translocase TatA/TatE family subunit [Spirochaetota bacterium]
MVGLGEALIIGAAVVLLFGATQIPKLARSLGEGLKEFKKAVKEAKEIDTAPETTDKEKSAETKKKG